jgi:catecholate siderophore receptor
MKAHTRPPRQRRRARRASHWLVAGAVVGSITHVHGASQRHAALPLERRIVLEPARIEAALAHVRIWTPSETLGAHGAWSGSGAQSGNPTVTSREPQTVTFAIPAGPLLPALRAFATLTGLIVQVDEEIARPLTTAGITGTFSAAQALAQLLSGTSLSFRAVDARTVAIEIRIDAAAVEVSATAKRVASAKYSAPLGETPQTIQVIPRALIEEQGAATLSDALRNVPGITMQAGEGGGASNTSGDMFNMRGFPANNSLFVDGVRDDGLIARDVYNLEQIEVFSGPTGSDVGRTNAAGYINLSTKVPTLDSVRTGSLSYAAGGERRVTADVNQPVTLGRRGTFLGSAAVRVNALWQGGGVPGRDYVERASKSIAPSVSFGLGTPTRATLSGQVMRQDNLADYGLPAPASPIGPLTPSSALAAVPVDQGTYYGSPAYDFDSVRQDNVMLRVEHDTRAGMTLRNQTRYNTTSRRAVVTSIANAAAYDPATNLVTLSRQANDRENEILSNQASVGARPLIGGVRHDVSAGLELTRETQFAPVLTGVGTRAPVDLHHPDVFSPVIGMDVVPSGALTAGRTDTAAVYVFDAFDAGPRVRVSGGIRVDAYDTASHAVSPTGIVTDVSGHGTLVSGKAGVLYRVHAAGNLYASYGSSLTPPGSANFQLNAAAANQNNPNVDPQKSSNYEVGTKWDLGAGGLQLSGAYFYTLNENVIFVVDATAVPPIFNQDDGQIVKGVAIGLAGQITPRWDVNVAVQYLDTTARSQNPLTDGRRLTLTPEVSGSLWTTVRLPRGIRAGGGLRYTDAVFVNAANTVVVPGYTVADAIVEAPIGQRLSLRLNAFNLTDRVYIRNINNNAGRYNPGTPRTFLLSTAIRF